MIAESSRNCSIQPCFLSGRILHSRQAIDGLILDILSSQISVVTLAHIMKPTKLSMRQVSPATVRATARQVWPFGPPIIHEVEV